MGLNLSHNLLLEGANNQYKIPEYRRLISVPYYEQSYIVETISSLNEEMRNTYRSFIELYSPEYDVLTEGERWDKIKSIGLSIFDKLIKLVIKIKDLIISAINKAITWLKNSRSLKRPKEVLELSQPTYIDILSNALADDKYSINIPNIYPSDYLLSTDFPAAKLDEMNRIDYILQTIDFATRDIGSYDRSGLSDTNKYVSQATDDLKDFKCNIGKELFSDFEFDQNSLIASAGNISKKAFGSNEISNTPVTIGLYIQAEENITKSDNIIQPFITLKNNVESGYNSTLKLLKVVRDNVSKKFAANNITTGPYANQADEMRDIIYKTQEISNIIQDAIYAHLKMITYKLERINQVYNKQSSGSVGVISLCDNIILKYLKNNKGIHIESTYDEDIKEMDMYLEQFNYSLAVINELYMDQRFNEELRFVLEADGDNNQQSQGNDNANANNQTNNTQQNNQSQNNNSTQQNTNTTTNNNNSKLQQAKQTVMNAIQKIIQSISDLFKKFVDRISQMHAAENAWWAKNRDKYSKMDISKVMVNQWYCYDVDKFKKDSFVEWNPDNEAFTSDENMEKAIYDAIGGTPNVEGNDASFTDKVKSLYYTKYINDENGSGDTFASTGLSQENMNGFIEDIFRGNNGQIIKSIKDGLSKADRDSRNIQNMYSKYIEDMAEKSANNPQEKTETQNANNTNNQTGSQNESFTFNDSIEYDRYILESKMSSKTRNNLPDSEFGLPKQRRFPINDKPHVLSAIRFFNHVEKQYESELASNIIKKIHQFKMEDEIHVGPNNRFKTYWDRELSKNSKSVKESSDDISSLFKFNLADELGLIKNEASFVVNDELRQESNSGASDQYKEFNERVLRYAQYNTKALGAKMTLAIAAYKQFVSLYKSIDNAGKKSDNKNNTQNNNNNQENNNQQQNQNDNNEKK